MCWGDEAVDAANATKNRSVTEAALKILNTKKNGSIMAAFEQVPKGTPLYSTR